MHKLIPLVGDLAEMVLDGELTFEEAVDAGVGRLKPLADHGNRQVVRRAERLRELLGEDYGVVGELSEPRWRVNTVQGTVDAGIIVGGRRFSWHPDDGTEVAVWREHDGHWDYADVDGAGEATGPWVCTSSGLPPQATAD